MAGTLDQVTLLRDIVRDIGYRETPESPLGRLARQLNESDGMARFFPWGIRLARLLDECAGHMTDATDIRHLEDEVAPFAAAILSGLRRIQNEYRTRLHRMGLSTPGMERQKAALLAGASPDLPLKLQGKTILIAGFVRLTESEDALFRYLWEQGAHICLHTDPDILRGKGHWSCAEHRDWLTRWKAKGALLGERRKRAPVLHFYAGYDLHSQLHELRRELLDSPHSDESRAVVLSHDALLMPTLHHIPEKNINISLGYPLERSLLARLVERLFQTCEGMDAQGRVHWKALLGIISHPYIRMLGASPVPVEKEPIPAESAEKKNSADERLPLRPFLARMEKALRVGSPMVDARLFTENLLDEILGDLDGPLREEFTEENGRLLENVIRILVTQWHDVRTLRSLADGLSDMCLLLLEHGRPIWPRFPLDTECMVRLMQNVIPSLAENAMADEVLDQETLFSVARQLLSEERVPFEADPLTGLQILGTLETRLLRFDRVYMVDLTEDALPGAPAHDPLLPDNLRSELGLPDTRRRDLLAAHTFHRLIAGAKEVFLYWQEGVQSGVMDGKKTRSRFVEEAVWQEEQARKRLLKPGDAPLRAATFPFSAPPHAAESPILRTASINARMNDILSRSLSPTRIDEYLSCPARFFYAHVCRIRELEEVLEDDDHAGVGSLLHEVLYEAYAPFVGKYLHHGDITPDMLLTLFSRKLTESGLLESLPPQSRFMLEAAGPKRLRAFLEQQPSSFQLIQVEHTASATLEDGNRRFLLEGKLDRLDLREEGLIILDYKSGNTRRQPLTAFWEEERLWDAMEAWLPGNPDPLPELSAQLPSLQLPCYLYLCGHDGQNEELLRHSSLWDAAWVQLADKGQEVSLLGRKLDGEQRERILTQRIPALLRFVLRHMATAAVFEPLQGKRCKYCPFRRCCQR